MAFRIEGLATERELLSPGAQIFLYLLGLIYCFLGVAIIADVFMSAVEKVTSAPCLAAFAYVPLTLSEVKKQIWSKELNKKVTVKAYTASSHKRSAKSAFGAGVE